MSKLLVDGDSARFGPFRQQVSVYADDPGRVALHFQNDMVLSAQNIQELADWLVRDVAPSIENIYDSVDLYYEEEDEGYE